MYFKHNGHKFVPLYIIQDMAEVAKRRMSRAKAALERELKDIERKKDIQHKRIESAFDQLFRIIEERKQAIHQ